MAWEYMLQKINANKSKKRRKKKKFYFHGRKPLGRLLGEFKRCVVFRWRKRKVWFRNGKGSVQTQQALFGGRQAVHSLLLPPFAEITFIMF